VFFFFFQAEDGIRDFHVTGVQTCALPIFVFGFFLLLFLSVSLGFYFAELFGSNALGFLALGGFYLLLIIILLVTKKSIEKGLMNLSIRKFLQKWNETHDDKPNN